MLRTRNQKQTPPGCRDTRLRISFVDNCYFSPKSCKHTLVTLHGSLGTQGSLRLAATEAAKYLHITHAGDNVTARKITRRIVQSSNIQQFLSNNEDVAMLLLSAVQAHFERHSQSAASKYIFKDRNGIHIRSNASFTVFIHNNVLRLGHSALKSGGQLDLIDMPANIMTTDMVRLLARHVCEGTDPGSGTKVASPKRKRGPKPKSEPKPRGRPRSRDKDEAFASNEGLFEFAMQNLGPCADMDMDALSRPAQRRRFHYVSIGSPASAPAPPPPHQPQLASDLPFHMSGSPSARLLTEQTKHVFQRLTKISAMYRARGHLPEDESGKDESCAVVKLGETTFDPMDMPTSEKLMTEDAKLLPLIQLMWRQPVHPHTALVYDEDMDGSVYTTALRAQQGKDLSTEEAELLQDSSIEAILLYLAWCWTECPFKPVRKPNARGTHANMQERVAHVRAVCCRILARMHVHPTMKRLLEECGDDINFVLRQAPNCVKPADMPMFEEGEVDQFMLDLARRFVENRLSSQEQSVFNDDSLDGFSMGVRAVLTYLHWCTTHNIHAIPIASSTSHPTDPIQHLEHIQRTCNRVLYRVMDNPLMSIMEHYDTGHITAMQAALALVMVYRGCTVNDFRDTLFHCCRMNEFTSVMGLPSDCYARKLHLFAHAQGTKLRADPAELVLSFQWKAREAYKCSANTYFLEASGDAVRISEDASCPGGETEIENKNQDEDKDEEDVYRQDESMSDDEYQFEDDEKATEEANRALQEIYEQERQELQERHETHRSEIVQLVPLMLRYAPYETLESSACRPTCQGNPQTPQTSMYMNVLRVLYCIEYFDHRPDLVAALHDPEHYKDVLFLTWNMTCKGISLE